MHKCISNRFSISNAKCTTTYIKCKLYFSIAYILIYADLNIGTRFSTFVLSWFICFFFFKLRHLVFLNHADKLVIVNFSISIVNCGDHLIHHFVHFCKDLSEFLNINVNNLKYISLISDIDISLITRWQQCWQNIS